MKKLDFYSVDCINSLSWPTQPELIDVDSSALEVFTDFHVSQPLVIEANTLAIDAQKFMFHAHVRLKIVIDENNHFLGLLSLDDLNTQEIVKHVSKGDRREEMLVTDFMRSRKDLQALNFAAIEKASIMDVIQALKTAGQQHCLVVDFKENKIRGIISVSDISRKLKLPLDITMNSSFISIFNVLHH
ncbi:MAG: CBS domain containing-hemolysin-like protein [Oleiphilaceae bacterium]|jgi:CBS domain containing-hemolysin-like protein